MPHAPDLFSRFRNTLPENLLHSCIEAALSGGLDSVVLLHLLTRLRAEIPFALSAVHVHHGLQAAADDWVTFCRHYCQALAVALRVEYVQIDSTQGLGIEAAARQARYAVFAQTHAPLLALAHHADDQVETFFLSALRGGGIRALSAMPPLRPLNDKTVLWRPLLAFTRAELAAYADEHGLSYISDPSNQDSGYLRNWLRNNGLPQWRERLPHLDQHIQAAVALLQDELTLLEECVAADAQQIHADGFFHIDRWRALGEARRRQQLLHFARRHGLGTPAAASVHDFARILAHADTAQWLLPHGEARAYRQRLFPLAADWQERLRLPEQSGTLLSLCTDTLRMDPHTFRHEKHLCRVTVHPVYSNDRIPIQNGHKSVRKLLQERHIAPFVRPLWPVITDENGACVVVPGLWAHNDWHLPDTSMPICPAFAPYIVP